MHLNHPVYEILGNSSDWDICEYEIVGSKTGTCENNFHSLESTAFYWVIQSQIQPASLLQPFTKAVTNQIFASLPSLAVQHIVNTLV